MSDIRQMAQVSQAKLVKLSLTGQLFGFSSSCSSIMHHCNFCLKGNFKTVRAVSIHISRTRACKEHMDRLRNHGRASKEATQATPNNDHEMDVDGDIPWEIDGQVDGIQEEPRLMMPDQNCSVQVEEVDDKESMWMHFMQLYPGWVAQMLGHAEMMFHDIKA
jgi:hypothetical protein